MKLVKALGTAQADAIARAMAEAMTHMDPATQGTAIQEVMEWRAQLKTEVATGLELDYYAGVWLEVPRLAGEDDSQYRQRALKSFGEACSPGQRGK